MRICNLGFGTIVVVGLLFAHASLHASEQADISRICGAALTSDGALADRVRRITSKLVTTLPQSRAEIVTVDIDAINAWVIYLQNGRPLICIAAGIVRWTGGEDGQLAFVIAHELAHASDASCKSRAGRSRLASQRKSIFSLAFGTSAGDEAGDKRQCETRADLRGVQLISAAGFDPSNAVASLQRLQQLGVSARGGLLGRIFELGSDHPRPQARIRHINEFLRAYWVP